MTARQILSVCRKQTLRRRKLTSGPRSGLAQPCGLDLLAFCSTPLTLFFLTLFLMAIEWSARRCRFVVALLQSRTCTPRAPVRLALSSFVLSSLLQGVDKNNAPPIL